MADLLASPQVFCLESGEGFLLGRVVADEAELLTLAVAPAARRRGVAGGLVEGFLAEARRRGAATAFLEVAADNDAARRLYQRAGFAPAGRRRGYYHGASGGTVDALILSRTL